MRTPFVRSSLALGVGILFVAIVAWLCTLGVSVVVTETSIASIVVVVFRSLAHRCISVKFYWTYTGPVCLMCSASVCSFVGDPAFGIRNQRLNYDEAIQRTASKR
jgi:fatty-acid desaturase